MADPVRSQVTFATRDGSQALVVDAPAGIILPPVIEAHVPLRGPLVFYYASAYKIPVEPETLTRGLTEEG